ncbi:hypothetical protein AGE10_23330 [Salmonella enterica subsp. enterica serovar Kentucky]|nr:hypothetical protein AGE10_23330 [Salmonella enterica subsp. enterica serovar Kentucky]
MKVEAAVSNGRIRQVNVQDCNHTDARRQRQGGRGNERLPPEQIRVERVESVILPEQNMIIKRDNMAQFLPEFLLFNNSKKISTADPFYKTVFFYY